MVSSAHSIHHLVTVGGGRAVDIQIGFTLLGSLAVALHRVRRALAGGRQHLAHMADAGVLVLPRGSAERQ